MSIAIKSIGPLLRRFPRFFLVGGVSTAVQYAILIGFVEGLKTSPTTGSSIGFLASAALNYRINYTYTFSSSAPHRLAIPRFVATASVGLILNSTVVHALVEVLSVQYILSQMVATVVALSWNYFVHQAWSFKTK